MEGVFIKLSNKIGIPRALMYHYYYPLWRAFFEDLGFEVVLSSETNKGIVNQGVKLAVDDICLPFKVYYGHVLNLKKRVDYLFVPRFISLGEYNYVCPKFMGLPDMLKASIEDLPELIEPIVDLRKGIFPLRRIAIEIGRKFNKSFWSIVRAYRNAKRTHRKFIDLQHEGIDTDDAINLSFTQNNNSINNKLTGLNIVVLGHSYILNDKHISMNIIEHLRKMDANVSTVEMYEDNFLEDAASKQNKRVFWYFNRQVMGTAYHLLGKNQEIDGIIQVTAFACGPDSLVKELIDMRSKRRNISVLNINIDEHSGEAGLLTRLEAFVDLLERRKMA